MASRSDLDILILDQINYAGIVFPYYTSDKILGQLSLPSSYSKMYLRFLLRQDESLIRKSFVQRISHATILDYGLRMVNLGGDKKRVLALMKKFSIMFNIKGTFEDFETADVLQSNLLDLPPTNSYLKLETSEAGSITTGSGMLPTSSILPSEPTTGLSDGHPSSLSGVLSVTNFASVLLQYPLDNIYYFNDCTIQLNSKIFTFSLSGNLSLQHFLEPLIITNQPNSKFNYYPNGQLNSFQIRTYLLRIDLLLQREGRKILMYFRNSFKFDPLEFKNIRFHYEAVPLDIVRPNIDFPSDHGVRNWVIACLSDTLFRLHRFKNPLLLISELALTYNECTVKLLNNHQMKNLYKQDLKESKLLGCNDFLVVDPDPNLVKVGNVYLYKDFHYPNLPKNYFHRSYKDFSYSYSCEDVYFILRELKQYETSQDLEDKNSTELIGMYDSFYLYLSRRNLGGLSHNLLDLFDSDKLTNVNPSVKGELFVEENHERQFKEILDFLKGSVNVENPFHLHAGHVERSANIGSTAIESQPHSQTTSPKSKKRKLSGNRDFEDMNVLRVAKAITIESLPEPYGQNTGISKAPDLLKSAIVEDMVKDNLYFIKSEIWNIFSDDSEISDNSFDPTRNNNIRRSGSPSKMREVESSRCDDEDSLVETNGGSDIEIANKSHKLSTTEDLDFLESIQVDTSIAAVPNTVRKLNPTENEATPTSLSFADREPAHFVLDQDISSNLSTCIDSGFSNSFHQEANVNRTAVDDVNVNPSGNQSEGAFASNALLLTASSLGECRYMSTYTEETRDSGNSSCSLSINNLDLESENEGRTSRQNSNSNALREAEVEEQHFLGKPAQTATQGEVFSATNTELDTKLHGVRKNFGPTKPSNADSQALNSSSSAWKNHSVEPIAEAIPNSATKQDNTIFINPRPHQNSKYNRKFQSDEMFGSLSPSFLRGLQHMQWLSSQSSRSLSPPISQNGTDKLYSSRSHSRDDDVFSVRN